MNRLELLRNETARKSRDSAARRLVDDSPAAALRQVQRLLDRQLGTLPRSDRGPVACAAGCAFCCHLRVMATAVEVFALLDFLRERSSDEDFDAFCDRVHRTERALRDVPEARVLTLNLPCPALIDGRCSGYAGRPLNCRAYHSLSLDACRESFEHPEDLHRGHPQLAPLARVHAGTQAGLIAALGEAAQDARQYELVTALAEALADPAARQRLGSGQRVFVRAFTLDGD